MKQQVLDFLTEQKNESLIPLDEVIHLELIVLMADAFVAIFEKGVIEFDEQSCKTQQDHT